MARLPKLPYGSGIRKQTQVRFGGLRHSRNSEDGELRDDLNLSSEDAPVLGVRGARGIRDLQLGGATQMFADNHAFITLSDDAHQIFYSPFEGRIGEGIALLIGYTDRVTGNHFVRFGGRILLWPEKILLNLKYKLLGSKTSTSALPSDAQEGDAYLVRSRTTPPRFYSDVWVFANGQWQNNGPSCESMEAKAEGLTITIGDGTLFGEPAKANTITAEGINWEDYFRPGDGVTISGCNVKANRKTAIIREIEGNALRFSEYCFTIPDDAESYQEKIGGISIERRVPDLDFVFEHNNRLWGAAGKTIWASKLGDPLNWYVLGDGLSTDAWMLETQTAGDFTGGCSYAGYPTFFKEDARFIIYGTTPQAFQTYEIKMPGPAPGTWDTLGAAGGVLFYLSRSGMMAYRSEGYPESLNDIIGKAEAGMLAASNGRQYMIKLLVDGQWSLYHYDGDRGIWHREDDPGILSANAMDGDIYTIDAAGNVRSMLGTSFRAEDEAIESVAEFGDFTAGSADKKGVSRVQLRLELEAGTEITVKICYDDGEWITVRQLDAPKKRSVYLPVIPHRCDHYRIRLEGRGRWWLYSMALEQYVGSPMH